MYVRLRNSSSGSMGALPLLECDEGERETPANTKPTIRVEPQPYVFASISRR